MADGFKPGDFVAHRLTGEICIVLRDVGGGAYDVRCRDYDVRRFHGFELELYDQDYKARFEMLPVGWLSTK